MSNEWIHIAEVVSVDDPERAGRLQIRVLDQHDHYIPNDELLWARCSFPVTSAVHRGVGGPTTGIVVGSTVMVVFMDEPYHQIPIVIGVLGRSMAPEGPNTLPMGPQGPAVLLSGDQLPENRSDFPPANIGQDVNPVLEEQITNMTRDALESADEETIADVPYQGEKIQDTISRKNNIVDGVLDAIDIARRVLTTFTDLKYAVENGNITELAGMLESFGTQLGIDLDYDSISGIADQIANVNNEVNILSNDIGAVVASVEAVSNDFNRAGNVVDTAQHLAGSIGDRTSKISIEDTATAYRRINGNRFVMSNVMSSLDNSITSLRERSQRRSALRERRRVETTSE